MVLLAMVLLVAFEVRVVRFLSTTIQVNDGLAYHGAFGGPRGVRAVDAIETERIDLTRQVIVWGRAGLG